MSQSSKISVANMFILTIIMLLAWSNTLTFDLVLPYRWHKFLHLAGVVVFLGNVILGPLWVTFAFETKRIETIRFSFNLLQKLDIYITAPSVFMVVVNGLYMGNMFGGVSSMDWLKHSVYSLILLWLFIIPILIVQDKIGKLLHEGDFESKAFLKLKKIWMAIGFFSFLPIVYICYMMVFKTIY